MLRSSILRYGPVSPRSGLFFACKLYRIRPEVLKRGSQNSWAKSYSKLTQGPGSNDNNTQVEKSGSTASSPELKAPESIDRKNDLNSNTIMSRLPRFSLHKDVVPTLIPKSDTPRVGPNLTFAQLIAKLQQGGPKLLYMAESHRLYFSACFALAFIAAYNLFDLLDQTIPLMINAYRDNEDHVQAVENLGKLVQRFSIVGLMSAAYLFTSLFFIIFPSRLVRRIEYIPDQKLVRLVTHPWVPSRPSPVISVPVADMTIGNRTKVWTGDGFYGATSKSSFFFFLWEKGHRLPWIVDRSGWFWGDARVYDVVFGKEPIALAEKGLSYDDMLRKQMLEVEKKKAEMRRELGPAWQLKAMGKLMQEDVEKVSKAGQAAVMAALQSPKAKSSKQLPDSKSQSKPDEKP